MIDYRINVDKILSRQKNEDCITLLCMCLFSVTASDEVDF